MNDITEQIRLSQKIRKGTEFFCAAREPKVTRITIKMNRGLAGAGFLFTIFFTGVAALGIGSGLFFNSQYKVKIAVVLLPVLVLCFWVHLIRMLLIRQSVEFDLNKKTVRILKGWLWNMKLISEIPVNHLKILYGPIVDADKMKEKNYSALVLVAQSETIVLAVEKGREKIDDSYLLQYCEVLTHFTPSKVDIVARLLQN